tara:strand:- start:555 stop:806 length:252 start_codon:yes stop_codon:yes gene_type:complete
MAGHNKNHYRLIAIEQFYETLYYGESFHIRACVLFLNTRRTKRGTLHRQTQTFPSQCAELLKRTKRFYNLGNGNWKYIGDKKL